VTLRTRRILAGTAAFLALVTAVATILLRPTGEVRPDASRLGFVSEVYDAEVVAAEEIPCPGAEQGGVSCRRITYRLLEGPDSGRMFSQEFVGSGSLLPLEVGDPVVLARDPAAAEEFRYRFVDRRRISPIVWLALAFALAVVLLGGLRGLTALAGLAASLLVLIAIDLAVRRPDLVQTIIEHEGPWRFTRHLPTGPQVAALATIGSLVLRGRQADAAEALLRSAYSYRDGGTAWDAFPEEWRRVARENARATLWDFLITIGSFPSRTDLATVRVPVVCSYGARSPDFMGRLTRSLAAAIPTARTHRIEGAAHAAPFDATANFVQLIADTIAP
jgi:hypothetical protein